MSACGISMNRANLGGEGEARGLGERARLEGLEDAGERLLVSGRKP